MTRKMSRSMKWLPFVAVPLLAAPSVWALEGAPAPAGTETTINDYRLWVPDRTDKVRGVIAVSNHEAGSAIYYDNQTWGDQAGMTLGYRDLAARLDLGLFLFKKFAEDDNYVESHQREIYAALDQLAQASGHPEVQQAGIIPTGLSAGGWWSGWLAQFRPARVIAYYPIAGGPKELVDVPELLTVPSLYVNQGADGFYPGSGVHVLPLALAGRAKGAIWGGIFTPPAVEHHHIFRHDFMLVWLEDVLQLRLPSVLPDGAPPTFNTIPESSGWLVNITWHDTNGMQPVVIDSVTPYKYADYPGDKSQGHWMPSQRTANAYVDYVMHDGHLPDSYAHGSAPRPPQPGGGATGFAGSAAAAGVSNATGGSSAAGSDSANGNAGASGLSTGGGPSSSPAVNATNGDRGASPRSSSCASAAPASEPLTTVWPVLLLLLNRSRARRRRAGSQLPKV